MALPGKNATVKIGANVVAEINDASFAINGELVDITAFDSGGFRKRRPNLVDATISISGFYNSTDTNGQVALRNAVLNGTKLSDVTVLASTAADSGLKADMYVESFEISPSVEGAVPVSMTLQSDGTVAVST